MIIKFRCLCGTYLSGESGIVSQCPICNRAIEPQRALQYNIGDNIMSIFKLSGEMMELAEKIKRRNEELSEKLLQINIESTISKTS